jgi:hypothetical protein
MNQILITDPVSLRQIIEFAETNGCIDQLGRDLVRLLRTVTIGMTAESNRTAHINRDFAPMSMTFAIWQGEIARENLLLNGGWIYNGPGCPADGSSPTFSVNLNYVMGGEMPPHSWTIHT